VPAGGRSGHEAGPLRPPAGGADAASGFQTIELGHLHIHQDQIRLKQWLPFEGLLAIDGGLRRVTETPQHQFAEAPVHGTVIHHQEAQGIAGREGGSAPPGSPARAA